MAQIDLEERRDGRCATLQGARPRDAPMLRYTPSTLKTWDKDVKESIFRDLVVSVPNKLNRVKLV